MFYNIGPWTQCFKTLYRRNLRMLPLLDRLHWHSSLVKSLAISRHGLTCLGHLRHCDINRNNLICVASPKVANASTVSCRCRCRQPYPVTFANVNMAYITVFVPDKPFQSSLMFASKAGAYTSGASKRISPVG
jgi:hypothetical protein